LAFDDFGGDLDQTVRELRCSDSVRCPHCDSRQVTKRGFDDTQKEHSDFLKMIADLRICGFADLRICGLADLRTSGLGVGGVSDVENAGTQLNSRSLSLNWDSSATLLSPTSDRT
jgi:hypothetical protein